MNCGTLRKNGARGGMVVHAMARRRLAMMWRIAMSDDKRCGTYKWFDRSLVFRDRGECDAPIPDSVDNQASSVMSEDEGTTCPCWEAKQ